MDESTSALAAAVIGAGAAVLVGGLAFWAAMRQVRISANMQREHSFWASRRDTYARYTNAIQAYERLAYQALSEMRRGQVTQETKSAVMSAGFRFEEVHFVLALDMPVDVGIQEPYGKLHQAFTDSILQFHEWHLLRDGGVDVSPADHAARIAENLEKMREAAGEMFVGLRTDLHRRVGTERR
ncbi:hypothetical protein [Streptomyces coeruleorubidus]|uniref:hypothetical protein n=1 Tax=Streptomyces coeruleorubidus TaxID=116188 RepID=UPI00187590F2|nr:hypothetical protein [Streptomyces bellus]GGU06412.1 hypothetical protein GCM10010244_35450 [Streptomyces bellus]